MNGTKLIKLKDGTLIEVASSENDIQQISNKEAEKVKKGLEQIKPLFQKSIDTVVQSIVWVTEKIEIENVEIELGLGFEGEGNIYVVRGTGSANFNVKFTIKPKR